MTKNMGWSKSRPTFMGGIGERTGGLRVGKRERKSRGGKKKEWGAGCTICGRGFLWLDVLLFGVGAYLGDVGLVGG